MPPAACAAALTALAALPLLLASLLLPLPERFIAQVLLLADHVAELVKRRHHVVVHVVAALLTRSGHLQVLQHLLELLQHLARRVLGAGSRHLLKLVDHAPQILRAQLAGIGVERPCELLRVLAHLLGERLHELVERGAQLAMRFADEAVIVTNPEVSSVRDSDRIIGLLDARTLRAEQG